MKQSITYFIILLSLTSYSQRNCNLQLSKNNDIYAVDVTEMKCIAQNSDKKNTLFFTFGIWCEPCRLHLPNAIKFAAENNVDFYVVLVEAETDGLAKQAIDYLKKIKSDINILILKDEIYGLKRSKKNKKFVTEITPKELENIADYSKYILINNTGKVLMVTNWKDNQENDWTDDTKMVKKRIAPLL